MNAIESKIIMLAALLYMVNGGCYFLKGNLPWALVWLSYGMANIGLMWAASRGGAQ
jgi:hypothetical protein